MSLRSDEDVAMERDKTFQSMRGGRRKGDPAVRLEFSCVDVEQMRHGGVPEAEGAQRQREERTVQEESRRTQEEVSAVQLEAARTEAKLQAREEWQSDLDERVAMERGKVLRAMEIFALEKTKYFAGIEGEVVKLALAIAKRVLHREATLDPMLLGGAVRVALERLTETSGTALRVPAAEATRWREEMGPEVEVIGDEALAPGECVLETKVGHVELGVKAQLEEIERGFFDLLQLRPAQLRPA